MEMTLELKNGFCEMTQDEMRVIDGGNVPKAFVWVAGAAVGTAVGTVLGGPIGGVIGKRAGGFVAGIIGSAVGAGAVYVIDKLSVS